MEISQTKKVPILLQFFNGLTRVFNSYGEWLYGEGKSTKIKKNIYIFKNALNYDQNKEYHEIINWAKELIQKLAEQFN